MIQVYHRHIKSPGLNYCNPGARQWFKRNGLNWSEFVRNGLPDHVLLATNDAMAIAAVNEARKEWVEKVKKQQ